MKSKKERKIEGLNRNRENQGEERAKTRVNWDQPWAGSPLFSFGLLLAGQAHGPSPAYVCVPGLVGPDRLVESVASRPITDFTLLSEPVETRGAGPTAAGREDGRIFSSTEDQL